ncbi:MAG: hypothetical protein M0R02_10550, partial [Bacteroidales bacterium]|nr:hypothetical protein [Bacteroidales bacterium]
QWYSDNTTTTSLATAPTPDVSNSGTISYFVSQTIDGCESERAEITVTTTETLPPTVVSPISACVGDVMAPLSATGVDYSGIAIILQLPHLQLHQHPMFQIRAQYHILCRKQ